MDFLYNNLRIILIYRNINVVRRNFLYLQYLCNCIQKGRKNGSK